MAKKQNPLHIQWYDYRCPVETLVDAPSAMLYFAQPDENPFYERNSLNERVRQQTGRMDPELARSFRGVDISQHAEPSTVKSTRS